VNGLDWFYIALVSFGLTWVLLGFIARCIHWALEVADARHRRRHAARRRARAKGYLPIFDDQIDPMELLKR